MPDVVLVPDLLKVSKVSGSLTNAVFFVSYPSIPFIKTLLLRIYGPSSSNLISRPRELHTLHILSSQYRIGPRVYGTFENGRMEEYFDSVAISASDMRNPKYSRWIGARMAELHCVDVEAIEGTTPVTRGENRGWEIAARKNVRSWLAPARQVLALPVIPEKLKKVIQLDAFVRQWEAYIAWVKEWELANGASKRVFAHNDAQYGNLLCLSKMKEDKPEHHRVCISLISPICVVFCSWCFLMQIIVVDFEYSAPNPAAFDIANHFHEWTADYHGPTPHILDPSRYPTEKERRNFYRAYLTHACPPLTSDPPIAPILNGTSSSHALNESEASMDIEAEMQRLEEQVRVWSPASHAMWAIWGIVQAMEDMKAAVTNADVLSNLEFDYLGYARSRMEGFRREVAALRLS